MPLRGYRLSRVMSTSGRTEVARSVDLIAGLWYSPAIEGPA
ncbi:MAG: hypothetical protein OJF52_003091 [Nitrospira sp.]|nr:MAG: hypothetical protein OJF52_003091 [Nitrospira sp.]